LPGGPAGPLARWAATSNVEEGSGTEEGAPGLLAKEGWLYSNKLFAAPPEFLVTPLLMEPICLINQGRFKEPVRSCFPDGNNIRYCRDAFAATTF